MHEIHTDVLIVGAGPAGLSLACFLGYYGISGLVISKQTHLASQPRAHITNMATWECLRDIGLEQEYRQVSLSKEYYGDYRYCYSLTGPDIIRLKSYGCEPGRLVREHAGELEHCANDKKGDYEEASPCTHADVSQHVGEPVLHKFATLHGFQSRFNCEFVEYSEDESTGLIASTLHDGFTGESFKVVSKYLCGADGANSMVAAQAGLQFNSLDKLGAAVNVWYEADLSHIYARSPGLMSFIFNPHIDSPLWSVFALNRVVRPYSEFVMGMIAHPSVTSVTATEDEAVKRLYQLIGDDTIKIKIKGIHRWRLNESYAETISNNKVFCLGDAIHRHSPAKGLGANTSIQDAYNLAWKLAYVLKGKASARLLESYNSERQPVGKYVVRTANDTVRHLRVLTAALGVMEPTVDGRMAALNELGEATDKGRARRVALKAARNGLFDENGALGAEMNQAYRSNAVVPDPEDDLELGELDTNQRVQQYDISTRAGARLPHAWLGTQRVGERLSTHDLAGKGRFTLFTGIGGATRWGKAIHAAAQALTGDVAIVMRSIGFGQEYSDMFYTWEKWRGVDDDGAVLVRPDRTVAWRCKSLSTTSSESQLTGVMQRLLGREVG